MSPNDKHPNRSVTPAQHPEESQPSRTLDVLVVEDNPVNRKVVVALLDKWGHHSVVACDGAQGLEAMERQAFDLVLMDIQMPVMDGLAATRYIREQERARGGHVPIIGITAHARNADKVSCLEVGMDRYLTKPLNSELLRTAIGELLPRAAAAPSPPAPEVTREPLDFELLKEFVGDDPTLLADVIQIFLKDTPETFESVVRAIAESNSRGVETSAHRLKGSLLTMGATAAGQTASELELLASEGVLYGAAELCERLGREIDAMSASLLQWSHRLAA